MSSPLQHGESPPAHSGSSGFTAPPPNELARLQTSFRRLLLMLAAIGIVAGVGVGLGLAWDTTESPRLLLLSGLGGAVGGVLSAGVSAMDRYSNGFELLDGQKVPLDAPPPARPTGRFSVRMLPQFYFRPLLGAGMGMIAFAGMVAGVLFSTRTTSPDALVPESVLFFSLVSGLFAKTLIERLKTGFKAMVGASDR
jgi:hypothetical protein